MILTVDSRSPISLISPSADVINENIYEYHFSEHLPGKDFSPNIKIQTPAPQSNNDSLKFSLTLLHP
jgi:hypothetical protein